MIICNTCKEKINRSLASFQEQPIRMSYLGGCANYATLRHYDFNSCLNYFAVHLLQSKIDTPFSEIEPYSKEELDVLEKK